MKALVVFDLDGTLAASKSAIDPQMAKLLTALLAEIKVAIISGGDMSQFKKQVLGHLSQHEHFGNLSLLPTCGTRFFQYTDDWHMLYSEDLYEAQKHAIIAALNKAATAAGFQPKKVWDDVNRSSTKSYNVLSVGSTGTSGRKETMGTFRNASGSKLSSISRYRRSRFA